MCANLHAGRKIISHVATPRTYDDEIKTCILRLNNSTIESSDESDFVESEPNNDTLAYVHKVVLNSIV